MASTELDLSRYKLGWSDAEDYVFKPKKGLSEDIVREMSEMKGEPKWMRDFRLRALKKFYAKPMAPWFAVNMPDLDFDDIYYYVKPMQGQVKDWDALPESIKNTYEKLGIPEAERKYLAGVTSQYECLTGSTRVWTTSGMRPIKELAAGDVVFSLDEATKQITAARVVAQRCSGEKEVFEISARGRKICASANHPFLVLRDERRDGSQRARFKASWVVVEDLRDGDLVAIATDLPDFGRSAPLLLPERREAAAFPSRTSEDFCWWAGIYLGDGYLKHSGGYVTVEIAVDRTDEVLVAEIQRVMRDLFGLEMRLARDGLRLGDAGLRPWQNSWSSTGSEGRSHTKRFPDWSFGLPRTERPRFHCRSARLRWLRARSPDLRGRRVLQCERSSSSSRRNCSRCVGSVLARSSLCRNHHTFDADRMMQAYHLRLSGRFDRIPGSVPTTQ